MPRKKRDTPRNVTLEAQAAALLHSQGHDQARIKDLLGISQSEVSRLLSIARGAGWLQVRCVLPAEAAAEVERVVFPVHEELRRRLDAEADHAGTPRLRGLWVLAGGSAGTEPTAWDQRLEQFGRA